MILWSFATLEEHKWMLIALPKVWTSFVG